MNPAAKVHLVDRDRLIERVASISAADPGVIIPLKSIEMTNDGAGIRPDFMLEAVGVSLLIAVAVLGADFVFVEMSFLKLGNEQFPNAAQPLLHGVIAAIP